MDRDLLSLYLEEFNREFLSTPEDRSRLGETLVNGVLTVATVVVAGVVLLLF